MYDSNSDNLEIIDPTPYILNKNNVYIEKKFIESLLKRYNINVKIKNIEKYQQAMIHKSYQDPKFSKEKKWFLFCGKDKGNVPIENDGSIIPPQPKTYERLEFLGDSIIHNILGRYLFNRYPYEDEGFLTKLRAKLENGEMMAKIAKLLGFDKYMMISRVIDDDGGRLNRISILEDVFEAFIGALYLEHGDDVCYRFIINLYETPPISITDILRQETNFKDVLLRYYHSNKWPDPSYEMEPLDNSKTFKMFVTDKFGKHFAFGTGLSKKKASQEAARRALLKYGVIDEDDDSSDSNSDTDTDSDSNTCSTSCSD